MRVPALFVLAAWALAAQAPAPASDPFASLRFLVGEWQGENGKGTPGQGCAFE